jgi:hypothetical protein
VSLVNIEVSSGYANVLAGFVEGWQGKVAKKNHDSQCAARRHNRLRSDRHRSFLAKMPKQNARATRVKAVTSRGSWLRWKKCILIVVVVLLLAPHLPLT